MADKDSDDKLWKQVAATVTPLHSAQEIDLPADPVSLPPLKQAYDSRAAARSGRKLPPVTVDDVSQMDARTRRRLKQGGIAVEASLDLHGMRLAEAEQAFKAFILEQHEKEIRAVRVITGKGLRSESGRGVLQSALPDWLNDPAIRPFVRGYTHAAPEKGGAGVFLIMLKMRGRA